VKLIELMPLKGFESILFINEFRKYLDYDIESLDCGCLYLLKTPSTNTLTFKFISLCPIHSLTEEVHLQCGLLERERIGRLRF